MPVPGKKRFSGIGLHPAHKRHTRCRGDQVLLGIERVLLTGIQGHQAMVRGDAPSYFQATLRCEPRRTSAPGTCSLRIAAALIASAFGRIS